MTTVYEANHTAQVNGVCLHYAAVGAGKPVVLVHGNGESHDLFNMEIGQLADAGYHVFAPDSRGHGANERLNEYHFADMAEDMYRFIRMLHLEKPLFYGHEKRLNIVSHVSDDIRKKRIEAKNFLWVISLRYAFLYKSAYQP